MDRKDIEIERLTAELLFKEEEMEQTRKQREEEERRRQAAEAEARELKEKMAKAVTERSPPVGCTVRVGKYGRLSMGGGSEEKSQEEQRLERREGEGNQASGRKQGNDDVAVVEVDRDDAGTDSAHGHSDSARRFDESRPMMRDSAEHCRFVASQLIAHCPRDFLSLVAAPTAAHCLPLVATPNAAHFPPTLVATLPSTRCLPFVARPTATEPQMTHRGSLSDPRMLCHTTTHAQAHSPGLSRLLLSVDAARESAVALGRRGGEEVRNVRAGGDARCAVVQRRLQDGFSNLPHCSQRFRPRRHPLPSPCLSHTRCPRKFQLLIGIDSPCHFFSTLLDFACTQAPVSQSSRLQAWQAFPVLVEMDHTCRSLLPSAAFQLTLISPLFFWPPPSHPFPFFPFQPPRLQAWQALSVLLRVDHTCRSLLLSAAV
ncbi:unnamed protein product [Closterium sp. NIES-65]|nr:unnamed protein product [Closterium sp. NIES-65]